jgi:hypothetical protein
LRPFGRVLEELARASSDQPALALIIVNSTSREPLAAPWPKLTSMPPTSKRAQAFHRRHEAGPRAAGGRRA